MIFLTGDTHADWISRLNYSSFPESRGMSKSDYVIILGDFGLWHDEPYEQYNLDWLDRRPFTTLFLDGNHENYDRIYSNEFPIKDFHGGKVQEIRPSVFHLMRGECYTLEDHTFFAFGGASSHDISDGILEPKDRRIKKWQRERDLGIKIRFFRINHISWWAQELPSKEEMEHGRETLKKIGWKSDFILTHCAPNSIKTKLNPEWTETDVLTDYLEEIYQKTNFKHWFCGHYHMEKNVTSNTHVMYEQIFQLL